MSVTVQASKHPLKPDWVYAEVAANQSIYEISGGAPVVAYINGREVAEELHRLTKVKDEAHVTLWPVPQDDDVVRTVAVITVAVVAPIAAPALVPAGLSAGATAFATGAVTAGLTLAGTLAINALIPPQTPDFGDAATAESFNRLESITGTTNRVASFKPIPRLYGTFRYFPPIPMTARPFTEIVGDNQYFRMLLCLGYGPLEIGGVTVGEGYSKITQATSLSGDPIRIGETDINLFEEVEYEIGTPDQMTLYTDQIIEIQPAFTTRNSSFDDGGTGTRSDGQFAIRTTEPNVDEISLDVAGRLYSVNDEAKTRNAKVRFKIEYRDAGSSDSWTLVDDNWVISSSRKETIREGYRFTVPNGQYEVRLTRVSTTHNVSTSYANELTWASLRSIRSRRPFEVDGTVVMSLRIKASDQLNGRIDDLSILATSVLDVYDGSSWSKQATNNPAWVYADIWTGTANRRPLALSDLDADALKDWADYCEQESLEYNSVFDSSGTTLNRAGEVAGAGLASWQFNPDSQISVVRDIPQTLPKMVISPRNSFGFKYELSSVQTPEGLRVQFVDDRTWENTERLVFDDGFNESNATLYETIQAKGVTNPDQAWKYGRYHLAQQRLRPERYTFMQDVQHLRYTRGDLLTLQHDVILVGITAGRVSQVVSDTEIVLDEIVADAGGDYAVKIQHKDGTITTIGCTPQSGSLNKTLVLDSAVPEVDVDDLVIFGESGQETIDVKVTQIEPQGDFAAQITCVPASPEIENAWDGNIPDFIPVITEPVSPDRVLPPQPTISDIRSDETVLYVDDDGSFRVRMVVETSLAGFPGWDAKTQIRFRPVEDDVWQTQEPTSSRAISVFDVDEGVEYEVQVRGVKGGLFSPWTASTTHTVIGKSTPPPDIDFFNVLQNGETAVFRWQQVNAPDIDSYEIRFGDPENSTWEDSVRIVDATKSSTIAQADVPPGEWTFYIKALDTAGNTSINAAERTVEITTDFESVSVVQHDPNWTDGTYNNFSLVGDFLVQDDPTQEAVYETDVVDLGFQAKDSRVWATINIGASTVDKTVDYGIIGVEAETFITYGLITDSATEFLDYGELLISTPVSDPDIFYEVAWSDDNVTFTDWRSWSRGTIDARYIKQRLRVIPPDDVESIKVLRAFKTVIDFFPRTERAQNLTVASGGTTFNFDREFNNKPVVVGTIESAGSLYAVRRSTTTTSVTFSILDSDGNDVGGTGLDYVATGI